ncbi:MAG: hypothetical protein ACXVI9_13300 [Mucilaginibacter sp.]
MKTTIICCVAIVLFVSSCQKSSVNPSSERTQTSISSKTLSSISSASSFNNQQDIDMSLLGLQASTCTGEPLQVVSGTYHIDVHGTINNNKLSVIQHANAQSFKLVGLGTGATYTGSANINESFNASLTNGSYVVTETETILFTTPGAKNNSIVQIDIHETINAKGQLTAYVDNLRFGCK